MEASGTTPSGGVQAPDLAEVVRRPGPFLTVYLNTQSGIDNAAQRSGQRWKTLRADLAGRGVDEEILGSVDPLVTEAHLQGECLCAVASSEGMLHFEYGPMAPPRDAGWWEPLPRLVPLLEWRQRALPHLLILVDRTGADLTAVRYDRLDVRQRVAGDDLVRKVAPGGWSQRRYQQRAENTWERTAEDVADAVTRLAERVDARVVVAAGDVRALQLLQNELPGELLDRFETIEGGRTRDGSADAVAEDVARVVDRTSHADTEAILEKFREELGQGDRAVEGTSATVGALAAAQVEVLLLHDEPEDDRAVWIGPDPTHISDGRAALEALGIANPIEGRLTDGAVRAALGTGASVRAVPPVGGPAEGIGAILRWSAP
jgi:hypothetical protein